MRDRRRKKANYDDNQLKDVQLEKERVTEEGDIYTYNRMDMMIKLMYKSVSEMGGRK